MDRADECDEMIETVKRINNTLKKKKGFSHTPSLMGYQLSICFRLH